MSFFGLSFGQNADIDIILDNQDERKMAEIRDENGRKERHFLFYDGESVTGKVNVTLHRKTSKLEHQGIKIQFIGQIELYYDRGNHHEFLSLVKELARPGDILQNSSFDFEFNQVEKPYECYTGANVRLRYFLRVSVARRITDMTKEMDLLVHTMSTYPEMNNPIKMEVGIEECLHIEFEYNKSKYHLKDVIVGKIYFLLVRIKIKHMEVAIIKRETTGSGPNILIDSETIAKYEIMDGAPVKGESIPIRVFLAGYDLTPTMRDINKKFSVKYYLNLVLVDEEERRYFKQQEITLWRKSDRPRKMMMYPQGQGGYMHYQPQIPHAMARHNPGDYPSHNVRTAPTPSGDDPMSPDLGGPPIPGPSAANRLLHPQESQEEMIPEEDEDGSEGEASSSHGVPETNGNQSASTDIPTHMESPVARPEPIANSEPVEVPAASPQATDEPIDNTQATEEPIVKTEPVVELVAEPEPVAEPVSKPDQPKETPKDTANRNSGVTNDEEQLVSKTKELSVQPQSKIHVSDDDDDDRPKPPDDDSIPDMDDSLNVDSNNDSDKSSEDDLFATKRDAELGNENL